MSETKLSETTGLSATMLPVLLDQGRSYECAMKEGCVELMKKVLKLKTLPRLNDKRKAMMFAGYVSFRAIAGIS